MELIFLILVSLVFAVIVFTILDRNSSRGVAIIGALVTLVVTFWLPFGIIIGAVLTLGVFLWAFSKTKSENASSSTTPPSA